VTCYSVFNQAHHFACYSSSSLIFLSWEQYKLAQVLSSNLISEWLYWRKFKWKKIT